MTDTEKKPAGKLKFVLAGLAVIGLAYAGVSYAGWDDYRGRGMFGGQYCDGSGGGPYAGNNMQRGGRQGGYGMRQGGYGMQGGSGMKQGGYGMQGGRGNPNSPMNNMMSQYDTDGDGKVALADIEAGIKDRFKSANTNGDEKLTIEEFEKMWLENHREMMVDRFQNLDVDGKGYLTEKSFTDRFQGMAKFMDRDGDGIIGVNDRRSNRRGGCRFNN